MIFEDSRYANADVYRIRTAKGTLEAAVYPPAYLPQGFGFRRYVVSEGDRLDTLAARFYGDPAAWWYLLMANPEVLDPDDLLQPGRPIRVPDGG